MSVFHPRTAKIITHPAATTTASTVPVSQVLTVWTPNGLTTQGTAILTIDQYPGQKFQAGVSDDGLRFIWSLPCGTVIGWGAWLDVTDVAGCAPYHQRVILTKDGPQQDTPDAPPAGNINMQPAVAPFTPAPRTYSGNMCGIYIGGLPSIPGGGSNPDLFLSWFYDRYDAGTRARIRAEYKARGFTDWLVSWPDSRAAGATPDSFAATCRELAADGFVVCAMMCSKDFDPSDVPELERRIAPALAAITRVAARICVGWELSIWLSPAQVQQLTDWMSPQVVPWGGKLYVHFQQGYASFDIDGPNASFAGYWNRNVGKLTGLLHQRVQDGPDTWDMPMYQARLVDILERFAGNYGCVPDSGFGHPFDCIALEITAMDAFNRNLSEADQDAWARTAVSTPASIGPLGPVRVMGSGNGRA